MLKNVQALRAIAALAVALSHLVTYGPAFHLLGFGTIGVELFFVISGFIMVYITADRPERPGRFMAHRIARVVPLYWLLTLAVFAIAWIAPHLLNSTKADVGELLKSLFFIPFAKQGGGIQPVLFQGWTLNLEMAFYVLFALSLMLGRPGARVALLCLIISCAVAARFLLAPQATLAIFYTSPVMLCFALGMVLGLYFPWLGKGPVLLAAGPILVVLALVVSSFSVSIDSAAPRILFAFAVVASALMLEQRGLVLDWAPVQLLGAASYSLYLIHPFASIGIEKLARKLGLLDGPLLPLVGAAGIGAMIVAGLALYHWVERPLQQRFRRHLR